MFLCLTSLDGNNIGEAGAVAVAGAIKDNKTLTTLEYVLIDEGVWDRVVNVEETVICLCYIYTLTPCSSVLLVLVATRSAMLVQWR